MFIGLISIQTLMYRLFQVNIWLPILLSYERFSKNNAIIEFCCFEWFNTSVL